MHNIYCLNIFSNELHRYLRVFIVRSFESKHEKYAQSFLFSFICVSCSPLDWLQYLKHFFINVSYHILVASLTLILHA